MKRFQVFTPGHIVYAVICAAALAAIVPAIAAGDKIGIAISALVAVAANGITAWLLVQRWRYARAIVAYTKQGVAIIPSSHERWSAEHTAQVEETVEAAILFWCAEYPKQTAAMRSGFDGGSLVISDHVLVNPANQVKAVGLASGKHMRVWWALGEDFRMCLLRLKHEAGHVALSSMGIHDEGESHRIMGERRFGA